jgi:hypothetical protein
MKILFCGRGAAAIAEQPEKSVESEMRFVMNFFMEFSIR